MKKVKPGEVLIIEGVGCRVDEGSADAINVWINLLEAQHVELGDLKEGDVTIHLHYEDGSEGQSFPPSKILEALERAEKADWNKTPHGL